MATSTVTTCMKASVFTRGAPCYSRSGIAVQILLNPSERFFKKCPHPWTTRRGASNRFRSKSTFRLRQSVNSSFGEQPASDEAPEHSSSSSYSPATPEVTPSIATPPEFESGEGKSSNQIIALLSVLAAIGLFAATKLGNGGVDLKLLASSSLPYDLAISNGRPTVVEFYADWCEVCRELAPEVYAIEQDYRDKVNFVMMNIDNVKWAQELAEFGVEGIPHFVFLDAQGNEEGNVVGKLPRKVLEANLEALARGDSSVPFSKTMAVLSVLAAIGLFAATKLGNGGVDLKLLASSSLPYDLAISNGRPTVVEFYADWCEVCRELAPEVYAIEQDYRDKVNFVMMNIDNVKWAQELAEFGVEGIPHFVFLDAQGNEEGNVVGKLPRKVLEANLEALARGDSSVPFSRVVGQYSVKSERGAPAVVEPRSHST